MGNCVGGFIKRKRRRISLCCGRKRRIVLCFIGLDNAGKTTVVKALQGENLGNVHPTIGFSRAEFFLRRCKVIAYDLGGGEKIREIWPTYYAEVHGVVYVVDASSASRLSENQNVVSEQLAANRAELTGKPFLFLLNKKDLPEPIDEMDFSHRFGLHEMAKQNKADVRVEGICAVKGTGRHMDPVLTEAMGWLIEKIIDNYVSINQGVESALRTLRARQAQERLERQHRLAALASIRTSAEKEEKEAVVQNKLSRIEEENSAIPNGYIGLSEAEILRDEVEQQTPQPPEFDAPATSPAPLPPSPLALRPQSARTASRGSAGRNMADVNVVGQASSSQRRHSQQPVLEAAPTVPPIELVTFVKPFIPHNKEPEQDASGVLMAEKL